MRITRIPEPFFTPERASRLRGVLAALVPPVDVMMVMHLDAPAGWSRAIDFGERGAGEISTSFELGRPLIESIASRYSDTGLNVSGLILGGNLSWQWRPVDGLDVYGRLPEPAAWETLLTKMREAKRRLARLLRSER